jgi:hypothetical protein
MENFGIMESLYLSPPENLKQTTSELGRLICKPADTIFFIFVLTYVISDIHFLWIFWNFLELFISPVIITKYKKPLSRQELKPRKGELFYKINLEPF